jgi:hypothetical protein
MKKNAGVGRGNTLFLKESLGSTEGSRVVFWNPTLIEK